MTSSKADLSFLVSELRAGRGGPAPSQALTDFAKAASRWSPRALVESAKALVKTEDVAAVARLTVSQLRSHLADIDEHGAQAEFADDKAFIKKALTAWQKQLPAKSSRFDEVLLQKDLEESLVVSVEYLELPPAEAKAWAALRKAKRLVSALPKKPVAPWFAELIAAYIAREVQHLAQSKWKASFSSKLADVPDFVRALARLGMPPIFAPRAVRWAHIAALGHSHVPTTRALATVGAAPASAADQALASKLKLRFAKG